MNGRNPIDPIALVATVLALGVVGLWLVRRHVGGRTEGRHHVRLMNAVINPLSFSDLDPPGQPGAGDRPTAASVLRFLCPGEGGADLSLLSKRYNEISPEPVRLVAVPAEQRILDKLAWPLRHAKASYMVGNYLAVIALCGMVAEMVALLIWEVSPLQINGQPLTDQSERAVFGSEFERLGQERRVRVLSSFGLIDSVAEGRFNTIRETRRGYLHLWSQDHDSLPGDARKSYHAAVALVATVIGQDFSDGKIVINPRLVGYLERKGVYQPRENPTV